jgi:hypothetical protein
MDAAFTDAARLRAEITGQHGYALAYGSQATAARNGSDLDLLFVGPPLRRDRLDRLVRAVLALHDDHGLRVDAEVAHDVKLYATPAEVGAALALHGFAVDAAGALRVPPVVATPRFLNSRPFKLRLVLNALTTVHVFLGGDVDLYQRHRAHADRAVTLLALSLLDSRFTVTDAVTALVTAADGATGKDYLGYTTAPGLHSTVHVGLARLATEQVVRTVDGVYFEQHHERRRTVTAELSRPGVKRFGGSCDNG